MTLIERLPGMADAALNNLRANALRLGETGSSVQRAAAAKILPALEIEIAARSSVKRERLAKARETAKVNRKLEPKNA